MEARTNYFHSNINLIEIFTIMHRTFLVYNCHLEERQLREGEHGLLAGREVVQAICDADFRDHCLNLVNPVTNMIYHHEYLKKPKGGLYLMKVVNPLDGLSLKVVIDIGMYPHYILIEKKPHNPKASSELAMIIRHSLNKAAEAYGWSVKMKKSCLNELYAESIYYAMAYADNLPGIFESIKLKTMEDFCMECVTWEEARPIVYMMEKVYGKDAPPQVRNSIKRIKKRFSNRIYDYKIKADQVVMNQPHVNGPVNSFQGNKRIDIGK